MRLFVAVPVPEAVLAVAQEAAETLRKCLPSDAIARWVPAANMHLTVRFIGHVDDGRVAQVLDALRPPLPIAPFEVAVGECGVFPGGGAPRVIWIGLRAGLPSLQAMHEQFDRRLEGLGFPSETRDFTVHLTLARIKTIGHGSNRSLRACVETVRPPTVQWHVAAATVFQSLLSPNGPTYRALLDVPCIR